MGRRVQRKSAVVVRFPAPDPARIRPAGDGPIGTVLLFTGVQYERPRGEPEPRLRRRNAARV